MKAGIAWHFLNTGLVKLSLLAFLHGKNCRFGDMRVEVVKQVIVMWQTLKVKKGNFIPNLIGAFLSLTLIKSKGLSPSLTPK